MNSVPLLSSYDSSLFFTVEKLERAVNDAVLFLEIISDCPACSDRVKELARIIRANKVNEAV